MDGFRHNPYVGSFHAMPVHAAELSSGDMIMNDCRTNPMIGLMRHSPPINPERVGLKSVIYGDQVKIPSVSQLRINREKNKPSVTHNFVTSLRQIPQSVFLASSLGTQLNAEEANPSEQSLDNNVPMCSICLENYVDGDALLTLACGHCFHSECVNKWFYQGCLNNSEVIETFRCPQCRQNHIALSEQASHASGDENIPSKSFLQIGQSLLSEGGYDFFSDIESDAGAIESVHSVETISKHQNQTSLPSSAALPCQPKTAHNTATTQTSLEFSAYSDCGFPLAGYTSKVDS